MDRNELAIRMHRVISDIKDLKFRQAVGGDSWVVYRQELVFAHAGGGISGHYYQVDFQPNTGGNFVAKCYWTSTDKLIDGVELTPDPNINGRWYMVDPIFGADNYIIFIYSTKKGNIIVTDMSISHPA
jgi:hypothetical protein